MQSRTGFCDHFMRDLILIDATRQDRHCNNIQSNDNAHATRAIVPGSANISSNALSALNPGPSFSFSPSQNNDASTLGKSVRALHLLWSGHPFIAAVSRRSAYEHFASWGRFMLPQRLSSSICRTARLTALRSEFDAP